MDAQQDHGYDIRPLVRALGKKPEEWTRTDLVGHCLDNGIRILNFRYPSLDGKLRELRLPINDHQQLERVLAAGERVDGSSLFPGLFDAEKSDLYAVPVFRWAFPNPWAEDELDIVCRFASADGKACPSTPDTLLAEAVERLRQHSGADLLALAELEFYLILEREDERFSGKSQRNYHQSAPYLHGRPIVDEMLRVVSTATGRVKYSHSEVGYIDRIESAEAELDGRRVEQYELEFDLMPIEELACWMTVARWLIRETAARHGASVTFVPKLDQGMAGTGLHLHLALERDGTSAMMDDRGELSDEAMGLIGGLLERAEPLAAFGNSVAASYLRLVPGQEAPTRICWGRHNRSTLIRVPLDFVTAFPVESLFNPVGSTGEDGDLARPTVEYRSPDGSAFSHLLLLTVAGAVESGLRDPRCRDLARKLEITSSTSAADLAEMDLLPGSAVEAAASLRRSRQVFEESGLPAPLLDYVIERLEAEADGDLARRLRALPAAERLAESRRLMHKDLHKH
jgi:glutamine synthetase